MTRIYTFGLEQETATGGAYLVLQVAHRDQPRAARVALANAAKERGGSWKIVHKACRESASSSTTKIVFPVIGSFCGPCLVAVEQAGGSRRV